MEILLSGRHTTFICFHIFFHYGGCFGESHMQKEAFQPKLQYWFKNFLKIKNIYIYIYTHTHTHKGSYSQSYDFSSSRVWMWELDHEEGWMLKNWCFWIAVLEKTFESPLDCKEIKPVNPKGNQSWLFIGRTVAATEAPMLWPPDVKSQLIGEDPDTVRDWGHEEKGVGEDKLVS